MMMMMINFPVIHLYCDYYKEPVMMNKRIMVAHLKECDLMRNLMFLFLPQLLQSNCKMIAMKTVLENVTIGLEVL